MNLDASETTIRRVTSNSHSLEPLGYFLLAISYFKNKPWFSPFSRVTSSDRFTVLELPDYRGIQTTVLLHHVLSRFSWISNLLTANRTGSTEALTCGNSEEGTLLNELLNFAENKGNLKNILKELIVELNW